MSKDPYKVLGVNKDSTPEEIKKAYREIVRKNHPDANPNNPEALNLFKDTQEAYEILGDPSKKSMFDSGGSSMHFRSRTGSANPFDIFNDVFGQGFKGNFKGRNVQLKIEIDFKESILGCIKQVKVRKKKKCENCSGKGVCGQSDCNACNGQGFLKVQDAPFEIRQGCSACNGTGKISVEKCNPCDGKGFFEEYVEQEFSITVPAGIEDGSQIRLAGQGEESLNGGSAGDLIVFVSVKDNSIFVREGANLVVEIPVSYTQLVLGAEIEVPTVNEGTLTVKIPAGSQSHTKFRVKGKGVFVKGKAGDLIIIAKIETPKILNEEYKKVIEQLAVLEAKNVTPNREKWNQERS